MVNKFIFLNWGCPDLYIKLMHTVHMTYDIVLGVA
jgi:hypothetical protein